MDPAAWLGAWIDERHLAPATVESRRETFSTQAPPALVLHDFLRAHVAARVSRFLLEEAEFSRRRGLKHENPAGTKWDDIPGPERLFDYEVLTGARAEALSSPNYRSYRALERAIRDPRTRALFEALTGMTLGEVMFGGRRMCRGDFLVEHTDAAQDRLISFVIYLTPSWERSWGGSLMLTDRREGQGEDQERDERRAEIVPDYNSIVIFDAALWHWVEPFADALGERARVSCSGWFRRP